MALHRQGSGQWQVGVTSPGNGEHKPGSPFRLHDHVKADQKNYLGLVKSRSVKVKRPRQSRSRKCSIGAIVVLLLVAVVITVLAADYVFPLIRSFKGDARYSGLPDLTNQAGWDGENSADETNNEDAKVAARESDDFTHREKQNLRLKNTGSDRGRDIERASTLGKNGRSVHFDHDLEGDLGTDSNTGMEDRRRNRPAIHGEHVDNLEKFPRLDKLESQMIDRLGGQLEETKAREENTITAELYNERGRKELHKYKEQFEATLEEELNLSSSKEIRKAVNVSDDVSSKEVLQEESDRERVGGGGKNSPKILENEKFADLEVGDEHSDFSEVNVEKDQEGSFYRSKKPNTFTTNEDPKLVDFLREAQFYADRTDGVVTIHTGETLEEHLTGDAKTLTGSRSKNTSSAIAGLDGEQLNRDEEEVAHTEEEDEEQTQQEHLPGKSKKRKKHTALPCEISFRNSTKGLREPTDNSRFESFSLSYIEKEDQPSYDSLWEPRFAGHQTLSEREESFLAKDQTLHCGFVKGPDGPDGYHGTGFEISRDDMDYLQTCHIAVSSCIFGNYDHIRNPSGKKVTSASKKKVCFAMFVDQPSLDGMIEEGEAPDENMNLGLWRIVLIKNLPYPDNRRTGKVPKFLTHRLFPNARYSVWLDSKLRLQSDPLLILEYFLWRGQHEYAISNHYSRHCVWDEVEQNKKLDKFNHSVIDDQFAFYQSDGLYRFNASDPRKLLPSHVPEGSFIVRAHTPMSNLFSCLWFNEVDRFTPRDQLSFAYTYMKLVRTNPTSHFRLNMFKDCERKAMAKLYRHKTEDALVNGRKH